MMFEGDVLPSPWETRGRDYYQAHGQGLYWDR